jgi:hypothetical protein
MKVRRKIYYVPGMITLIVLPILCYYYLLPFKKDERILEVIFAAKYRPEFKNYPVARFDTSFLSNPRTKRNYLDIRLNGDEKEDKIKLDFFRLRIREMIKSNDTVNGTHLLFVDSAKYGTFVQALNICKKEGLMRYAPFENDLWVLQINYDKATIERVKQRRKEIEEKNREELLNRKITGWTWIDWLNSIKKTWPIYLILIGLSYISINKMRNI